MTTQKAVSVCVYHKYKKIKRLCKICLYIYPIPKMGSFGNNGEITSMCLLKDGRIVSGGTSIIIYDKHTYKSSVVVEKTKTLSTCGLRNGNLAFSDYSNIQIWEMNEKNYKHIQTIQGNNVIGKIIELENGNLCFCCSMEINVYQKSNYYQSIGAFKGHTNCVAFVIEAGEFIISVAENDTIKRWNTSTYQSIETKERIDCKSSNGIAKLGNKVIIGVRHKIYIVTVSPFEYQVFESDKLSTISSVCVLRNRKVLIGNHKGQVLSFDIASNQILFAKKVQKSIKCIIESEDNKIFSCSQDGVIKVYDKFYLSYKY